MYLRDAHFEVIQPDMHMGLRQLTSNWLHVPVSESLLSKDCVRVLHPIYINDPFFRSIFPGVIIYYSTAFIGRVRFTTIDYAREKTSEDASIVFKTGSQENFGRIRRIFTVNAGEPVFYVDIMSTVVDFECSTTNNTYSYSNIRTGSFNENTNSVFVSACDILEKCVFYERYNKLCTFYRFPNLEESS